MSNFKRAAGAAVLLGLAVAGAAWAADKKVVIANDGGRTLVQFYVGERQMLKGPVAPGAKVEINGAEGGGGCVNTARAVFDDGSQAIGAVNVCTMEEYPATARGVPFCPGDPRCKGGDDN